MAGKSFGAVKVEIKGLDKFERLLDKYEEKFSRAVVTALREEAETIMTDSKENYVPVDFGTLRDSGYVKPVRLEGKTLVAELGYGGPAAPYALCVTGHMKVPVEGHGLKQMNMVRVGDKVLTQAGVWKPVTKVFRYPLANGTPLYRICAPWRKNKEHVLEVTGNHAIMVSRGGKNQWLLARDLRVGDELFHRRKQAHNIGSVVAREGAACRWCGGEFLRSKRRKRAFCSLRCYWQWRAVPGNNPLSGIPRPPEVAAKMSASMTERHRREPEKHPLRVLARKGHKSSHEAQIAAFLDQLGIRYESGATVGRRFVDFKCLGIKRIIEADGCRWHRDQAKDIARDEELLQVLGAGWEIVHIHYFEARWSPKNLIPNPLPNVYYVAVNPGPATYVEPTTFDRVPITAIDVETYLFKRGCGSQKMVFDLEVADIHSYTVAGMLVHNSVHENPRSGKTEGFSPSGRPYKHWAKVGQWKYLEIPFKAASKGMSNRIAAKVKSILRLG